MNTNTIPPLTTSAVEQLRTLIESAAVLEAPMREWEISLVCGRTVFYRQHTSFHAPDAPTSSCTDCGRRGLVSGSAPVDDDRERLWRLRAAHVGFRRTLDEVARLRRQLVRAERRVVAAQSVVIGAKDDVEPFGEAASPGGEIDVIDELAQQCPA